MKARKADLQPAEEYAIFFVKKKITLGELAFKVHDICHCEGKYADLDDDPKFTTEKIEEEIIGLFMSYEIKEDS